MITRTIGFVTMLVGLSSATTFAQGTAEELAFGQVFGSAGFQSDKPSGTMTDAPGVVLVFTSTSGQRSLTLTQQTGDFIALLEPGRYCLTTYTRSGKRIQLAKNQLKCLDVQKGKDARLDVMLVRQ